MDSTRVLTGLGVSPGRAVGPVVTMPPPVPEPYAGARLGDEDADAAVARIRRAGEAVLVGLEQAAAHATGTAREVLEATAVMATDPALLAAAERLVRESGVAPERAVWDAAAQVIEGLQAAGGYLAERAGDVADVRDRIVAALTGRPAPGVPDPGHPFVLVAGELAPADAAVLDPARVVALVTATGGPTSHTSILARALGIPAVVLAQAPSDGDVVLVDGGRGTVTLDPTDDERASAAAWARRPRRLERPGATADGHPVALLANVGSAEDARAAADAGAQGVGLFRTEVLFLDRTDPPSVDEQAQAYTSVLAPFAGRPVVVRTLDAGADKPLPFRGATAEPNPALGVRGLRTAAGDPELLEDQLRAVARAAATSGAHVRVMAPMVSTVAETEAFVTRCAAHGLTDAGVMVEVPAAALRAGAILARATFASIGTNDLTQYAMAADRMLGELAWLATPWQPAVLDLVAAACRGGAQQARPVGVCGEAAADPALAVVLVGLGVSSLSMAAPALADVAAVLATVTLDECRRLAAVALAAESADDARGAVRSRLPVLDELGL